MAYCAKCGVEVDNNVKKCPLCQFPIPDINETKNEALDTLSKYPEASNIYKEYALMRKNQAFLIVVITMMSAIIILTSIHAVYPVNRNVMRYVFSCLLAFMVYLFFFFNYLKGFWNLTGVFLTTLCLTYTLNVISGGYNWFYNYAVPLASLSYVVSLILFGFYIKSKNKDKLEYLPVLALLMCSSVCIGVDAIITYHRDGFIHLTWSVIVAISSVVVSTIIVTVFKHTTEKFKATVKRKLHI